MIRHRMRATDEELGDCLMTAVACVLEIDPGELPELSVGRAAQWYSILHDALGARGYRFVELRNDPPVCPAGYAIAIGPSARTGGNHACVALDGDVVHDPHPSDEGLARIDDWIMFVPFARSAQRVSPAQPDIAL